MGGPRTAEPPGPHRGTAADDGSAETPPRQSEGAGSARSKNGMHPRRKYDLLAEEAPEGGRDNAGDTGSEAGHGGTVDQNRTDPG